MSSSSSSASRLPPRHRLSLLSSPMPLLLLILALILSACRSPSSSSSSSSSSASNSFSLLLPSLDSLLFVFIPTLWNRFRSWLTPPCLFFILNSIILLITASSGSFNGFNDSRSSESSSQHILDATASNKEKKPQKKILSIHGTRKELATTVEQQKPNYTYSEDIFGAKSPVSPWRISTENYGCSDGYLDARFSPLFGISKDFYCIDGSTYKHYDDVEDTFPSRESIAHVPRLLSYYPLENAEQSTSFSWPHEEEERERINGSKESEERERWRETEEAARKEDDEEEMKAQLRRSSNLPLFTDANASDIGLKLSIKQCDHDQMLTEKSCHSEPSSPQFFTDQTSPLLKKNSRRSISLDSSLSLSDQKNHHNHLTVGHREASAQELSDEDFRKLVEDFLYKKKSSMFKEKSRVVDR